MFKTVTEIIFSVFLEFINIVILQMTMLTTPLLINIKTVETSLGTYQKLLESSF